MEVVSMFALRTTRILRAAALGVGVLIAASGAVQAAPSNRDEL
jgi:hypothetical protein